MGAGSNGTPILHTGNHHLQHGQLIPVGRFWVSVLTDHQSYTQETTTFRTDNQILLAGISCPWQWNSNPAYRKVISSTLTAKSCWQILGNGGTGRPIPHAGKLHHQHRQPNPVNKFWVPAQWSTNPACRKATLPPQTPYDHQRAPPLLHKRPHGLAPCGLYYHDILFILLYEVLCLTIAAIRKWHWDNW